MKFRCRPLLALVGLLASDPRAILLACVSSGPGATKADVEMTKKLFLAKPFARTPAAASGRAGPMPRLPSAEARGSALPWGGRDRRQWSDEAVLANATSAALNEGWSRLGSRDVVVAVPVSMIPSDLRPYGDGQTNAGVQFPDWPHKIPPLVATLVKSSNNRELVIFRVHKDLAANAKLEIVYFVETPIGSGKFQKKTASVALRRDVGFVVGEDTFSGQWAVDRDKKWGNLDGSAPVFVRPTGWQDWFPVDFRYPVYTEQELTRAAGPGKMPGGRPFWDPELIRDNADGKTAFQDLQERQNSGKMGNGWFYVVPKNIHAWMPAANNKIRLTATGIGWTWVIDKGPHAPFKTLYTCFERRDAEKETTKRAEVVSLNMKDPDQQHIRKGRPIEAPQTLVSGGGWHEIGDPAETIINNVEDAPVVVGMATGMPWHETPEGGAQFAYKLTDVVTVRWLRPGEGLVTPAGEQTLKEGYGPTRGNPAIPGGRNYHWFYFHADREVCTQEWVHNCVPTSKNNLGLRCSGMGG